MTTTGPGRLPRRSRPLSLMARRRLEADIRTVLRAEAEAIEPPPDLLDRLLSVVQADGAPQNSTAATSTGVATTDALVAVRSPGKVEAEDQDSSLWSTDDKKPWERGRVRPAWTTGIAAVCAVMVVTSVASAAFIANEEGLPGTSEAACAVPNTRGSATGVDVTDASSGWVARDGIPDHNLDADSFHLVQVKADRGVIDIRLDAEGHPAAANAFYHLASTCFFDNAMLDPGPRFVSAESIPEAGFSVKGQNADEALRRGDAVMLPASNGKWGRFAILRSELEPQLGMVRVGRVTAGMRFVDAIAKGGRDVAIKGTAAVSVPFASPEPSTVDKKSSPISQPRTTRHPAPSVHTAADAEPEAPAASGWKCSYSFNGVSGETCGSPMQEDTTSQATPRPTPSPAPTSPPPVSGATPSPGTKTTGSTGSEGSTFPTPASN